jgi:hypothetical protein
LLSLKLSVRHKQKKSPQEKRRGSQSRQPGLFDGLFGTHLEGPGQSDKAHCDFSKAKCRFLTALPLQKEKHLFYFLTAKSSQELDWQVPPSRRQDLSSQEAQVARNRPAC